MKFWQKHYKKRRQEYMKELTSDEDLPNTPEENTPPPEYSQPSPLERLPESVSVADSRQRGGY